MEDFVTYELAVKLEQKGFKQGYNIFGVRPIFSNETTIKFINSIGAYEKEYFGDNIPAPTISQVLKWLREEKNIYISIFIDDDSDTPITYEIYKNTECVRTHHGEYFALKDWNKCELSAIEYVFDNLI